MSPGRLHVVVLVSAALVVGVLGLAPAGAGTPAGVEGRVATSEKTISEVRVFGRSVKGRALRAYRIGDPTSTKKAVLIGTIHGNEAGPARILENLLHGSPVTGADIWVIPYLNRDGYARGTRKNARGVDLNRNFPVSWIRQKGHYNSGRRPASEPETRSLMRFLRDVRPDSVVSLHQPLNGVDTSYGKTRALARRLVEGLELPAELFRCNGHCHGTMTQWFNAKQPGAAITVEYGARMTQRQVRRTGPNGLLASVFADR